MLLFSCNSENWKSGKVKTLYRWSKTKKKKKIADDEHDDSVKAKKCFWEKKKVKMDKCNLEIIWILDVHFF